MSGKPFTSAFRDPDSVEATLKMFSGVKKGAIAVAVISAVYHIGLVLGWGGDSSSGALGSFHVVSMLFIFMLADGAGRLTGHMQKNQ